jgi:aryl-phospho-beta-D-glucosidase BglC (GH1 family)
MHGSQWVAKSVLNVALADSQNGRLPPILAARRPTPYSRNVGITFLQIFVFPFSSHIVVTADWESWLTQDDVDCIVAAGLNSIRVPLGFWIIEDIVDVTHEPYG